MSKYKEIAKFTNARAKDLDKVFYELRPVMTGGNSYHYEFTNEDAFEKTIQMLVENIKTMAANVRMVRPVMPKFQFESPLAAHQHQMRINNFDEPISQEPFEDKILYDLDWIVSRLYDVSNDFLKYKKEVNSKIKRLSD